MVRGGGDKEMKEEAEIVLGRDMVKSQYPTLEEILEQNVGMEFELHGIKYKIVADDKGGDDGSTT